MNDGTSDSKGEEFPPEFEEQFPPTWERFLEARSALAEFEEQPEWETWPWHPEWHEVRIAHHDFPDDPLIIRLPPPESLLIRTVLWKMVRLCGLRAWVRHHGEVMCWQEYLVSQEPWRFYDGKQVYPEDWNAETGEIYPPQEP